MLRHMFEIHLSNNVLRLDARQTILHKWVPSSSSDASGLGYSMTPRNSHAWQKRRGSTQNQLRASWRDTVGQRRTSPFNLPMWVYSITSQLGVRPVLSRHLNSVPERRGLSQSPSGGSFILGLGIGKVKSSETSGSFEATSVRCVLSFLIACLPEVHQAMHQ